MEQILLNGLSVDQLILHISRLIDDKLRITAKNEPPDGSDYLSRTQAADILQVSLVTLHNWTKKGWLKGYKIGNRVLYTPADIRESLKSIPQRKSKN